ncbi:hypothetical protein E2C01_069876 [Portunus trituberculatus]|uniref:Uncharacterized protein n=1 Tax=Portunus trituberculatus TaxID=210409 RepID=A0A5B7I0K2_PORTR|nr:hypothetical protein [Portunus trituberculatus]
MQEKEVTPPHTLTTWRLECGFNGCKGRGYQRRRVTLKTRPSRHISPPPHLGLAAGGPWTASSQVHPPCLHAFLFLLTPSLSPVEGTLQGVLYTRETLSFLPQPPFQQQLLPKFSFLPIAFWEEEKGCVVASPVPPPALRSPPPRRPPAPPTTLAPPTTAETTSYMLLCLIQNSSDLQGKKKIKGKELRREERRER